MYDKPQILRLINEIKPHLIKTRHIHHAWFEESFKPSTKLPYVKYPILLFTIRQRINSSPLCTSICRYIYRFAV